MNNTELNSTVEKIVSSALGISASEHSSRSLSFLYQGATIEVISSEYIDEQEPPYFDISRPASENKRMSDVCVFALKNKSQWDFYILRTSLVDTTFDSQSIVALSFIEHIGMHVKIDGIKKSVDLLIDNS